MDFLIKCFWISLFVVLITSFIGLGMYGLPALQVPVEKTL